MSFQQLIRFTLGLSCVFNICAACLIAFPSSLPGQLFGLPGQVPPLYAALLSFVVFLFGIIYAWLARQSRLDQPLLFVGGAGKLCFFIIIAITWLLDNASGRFVVLATGDLLFGSIWLSWLYSNRTAPDTQQGIQSGSGRR